MHDVKRGDHAVQHVDEYAAVPYVVLALSQRSVTHYLAAREGVIEITCNGSRLREMGTVSECQGRRFTSRIHFKVGPLALFTAGRHVINDFFDVTGNAILVDKQAQTLWVRKSRGRCV